jgi:hypothetical protein
VPAYESLGFILRSDESLGFVTDRTPANIRQRNKLLYHKRGPERFSDAVSKCYHAAPPVTIVTFDEQNSDY